VCLIVGYNGSEFCGSQKNEGVRTVEAEVETALKNMNAIAPFNYGDLKKIAWSRATRTDKSVHALQNAFSCKVHAFKEQREEHMEPFRRELNEKIRELLPEGKKDEVKCFCVLEVSNRFNAKINTSYREYSYYLPTFMLNPIDKCYVGKQGTDLKPEEQIKPKDEDVTGVKVVNGITITKRFVNESDVHDEADKHLLRDISHLTKDPKFIENMYKTRLTEEQKEELHEVFKTTFAGTKKYHNYTRDMRPDQQASMRFMI
jgi:tRNA pseudouridine(38-40) synthase